MHPVYFISDVHLGLQSERQEAEKLDRLEQLFALIIREGAELYLLGDIFDYWMEFRHLVPKGFNRALCLLSSLVDSGVRVTYFAGNHDFHLGTFFDRELGIATQYGLQEVWLHSKRFLVAHGDGLGKGDTGYKLFARVIRNRFNLMLLRTLHPDAAMWLMKSASRLSREHKPVNLSAEKNRLLNYAKSLIESEQFDYFVCGHNHCREIVGLNPSMASYVNLGTWIDGAAPYARFDGSTMELKEI